MKKVFIGVFLIGLLSGCQLLYDEDKEQETVVTEETIIERKEITEQLTNSDIYNINAYLSDLEISGFKSYDKENPDHDQLLNLGFRLYVYYGMDNVDYEEVDGRHYEVFPYDSFNEKINQYFDCNMEKRGNDEWLFKDNKYYHPSSPTGDLLNIVIQVNRVFDNGNDSFLAEGSIHEFESFKPYNVYDQYLQPQSTWTNSMKSELIGTVSVEFVYSEQLNHYVIDKYQAEYLSSAWSDINADDNLYYGSNEEKEAEENETTMYPMTAAEGLSILKNAYPNYTFTGDGEISYDAFNEVKETNEPAYVYTLISNETGDPYVGWVFSDGTYKLRCVAY